MKAVATPRPYLPACASWLRMVCTWQRCQVACRILVMATFSPSGGIGDHPLDAPHPAAGA